MRHPKTLTIAMVVGLLAMGQMPLLMAQQDEEAFLQSDEELDQDAPGMDDQADSDAWQADDEMAAEEDATAMDADAPAEGPPEADEESAEDEFSDLLEPNPAGLDAPGSGERPADVPASANTDGPAAPMTQTPTAPPSTPAGRCGGYGTVRSFDDSKGYGYIKPEDGGSDVFVHLSIILTRQLNTLLSMHSEPTGG